MRTNECDHQLVAMRGTQWEWWRVLLRVAATPVTLVADGVCGLGWCLLNDDDDGFHFGSRGCGGSRGNPNTPKAPPPPVVERRGGNKANGKPMVSGLRR